MRARTKISKKCIEISLFELKMLQKVLKRKKKDGGKRALKKILPQTGNEKRGRAKNEKNGRRVWRALLRALLFN